MVHVVQQGEYLSRIARQYGFADSKTSWNDPQNVELRKHESHNELYLGDKLSIQEKKEKLESDETEQLHTFVSKHKSLKLRLVVKDLNLTPLLTGNAYSMWMGSMLKSQVRRMALWRMRERPPSRNARCHSSTW